MNHRPKSDPARRKYARRFGRSLESMARDNADGERGEFREIAPLRALYFALPAVSILATLVMRLWRNGFHSTQEIVFTAAVGVLCVCWIGFVWVARRP